MSQRKWDRSDWIIAGVCLLPAILFFGWLAILVHFIVKWW